MTCCYIIIVDTLDHRMYQALEFDGKSQVISQVVAIFCVAVFLLYPAYLSSPETGSTRQIAVAL
uniref:Transmembrane protein n=1 Tax=Heterorhabditis bacteriophora TaxID=37862 RepID=A0A1I7W7E9_HETBA